MTVKIEEDKLREGLLGLVIALVEIIAEVLKIQAVKRITSGHLASESIERLGQSIMDIEDAINAIKMEQGLEESVATIRNGLDDVVDELLDSIARPLDDMIAGKDF
jgi:hypothetical protein